MAHSANKYYVPESTRWPLITSIGLFILFGGFSILLNGGEIGQYAFPEHDRIVRQNHKCGQANQTQNHQRLQRHFLDDKTAIAPLIVNAMRIPLAKMIVGALVHRVIEIVGPRIEGQLVHQGRIEAGLGQLRAWCDSGFGDLERIFGDELDD